MLACCSHDNSVKAVKLTADDLQEIYTHKFKQRLILPAKR